MALLTLAVASVLKPYIPSKHTKPVMSKGDIENNNFTG